MIFPKGEVRHEKLSTAYTNLSALLSSLKSERFSGLVEIEFPENRGVLFLVSGEVVNAEAKRSSDQGRLTGQEAARSLLALYDQKNGTVSVYRWPAEKVSMMAGNLLHEVLYRGLSTDFTRLDRLIMTLREAKHNGFIEILSKDHKALGVLFIQGGEPVDLFITKESGVSPVEKKSIPVFLENAIKQGTILNVYRGQGKAVAKAAPEVGPGGTDQGLREITQILQDLLWRVEKFLDGGSQKGTFIKAFKRSLIEKSLDYPFLDPFAGEFEYRDGTILFTGEANSKEFTKGIGDCLRTTLDHLEEEMPKNKMLLLKLKAGIESSLEQHREVMKRLGIDSALSSFLH
jgi:hypothetical protein